MLYFCSESAQRVDNVATAAHVDSFFGGEESQCVSIFLPNQFSVAVVADIPEGVAPAGGMPSASFLLDLF